MPPLLPLFPTSGVDDATTVWPTILYGNEESRGLSKLLEYYDLHKEISKFTSTLCQVHFLVIWRDGKENDSVEMLLHCLMLLGSHPSLIVRKEVYPSILLVVKTALFRMATTSSTAPKVPIVEERLVHLLRILSDQAMLVGRPSSPPDPTWPTSAFSCEDFDDDEDYDRYSQLSLALLFKFSSALYACASISSQIIREVAKRRPFVALKFLRYRVECACTNVAKPNSKHALTIKYDLNLPPNQKFQDASLNKQLHRAGSLIPNRRAEARFRSPSQAYFVSTCTFLVEAILGSLPEVRNGL